MQKNENDLTINVNIVIYSTGNRPTFYKNKVYITYRIAITTKYYTLEVIRYKINGQSAYSVVIDWDTIQSTAYRPTRIYYLNRYAINYDDSIPILMILHINHLIARSYILDLARWVVDPISDISYPNRHRPILNFDQ